MPKIICNEPGFLTGQVGSVEFLKGVAHTDSEHMLAFFAENPHRFEVITDAEADPNDLEQLAQIAALQAAEAEAKAAAEAAEADAKSKQAAEPVNLDDLTDEQVDEAYATNIPDGQASTRKGKQKALAALAAE